MQKQQLQAQVDLQNKIISDHNAQIAQHQQQELDHIRAQTQSHNHHNSGQPTAYNPSANSTLPHNPSASQQTYPVEKPVSQDYQMNQNSLPQQQYENIAQAEAEEEKKEEEEDSNNGWKVLIFNYIY